MKCFYTVAVFCAIFVQSDSNFLSLIQITDIVHTKKTTQFTFKDIFVAETRIPKNHIHPTTQETDMDTQLYGKVNKALKRNPYISGSTLSFETLEGRVILRGVVPSFFQKQMAQESLRSIEGIDEILNELEVLGKQIRIDDKERN